ncbi:hypothetical protein Tco_1300540, partial [Tanacetum coccineum]
MLNGGEVLERVIRKGDDKKLPLFAFGAFNFQAYYYSGLYSNKGLGPGLRVDECLVNDERASCASVKRRGVCTLALDHVELSAIAKSNNLKDMMILLFESENQKDLITADNMNMIAKTCLSVLVRGKCSLDYEAKVIIRSKLKYFKIIKGKLDYNRRKIFRTTCFGIWLDLAYFDHESHMIDYMLQKQCLVNDAHYDMPLTYYVNGRGLHFGRREFCLITGFRFGAVSFSSYSKGDMKFKERVFPHRVGLSITSLDLVGVIED